MTSQFFKMALAAASQSVDAFAAVFENKEANAKEKDKRKAYYVDPLVRSIIEKIPDATLPALLDILIQHGANPEHEDVLGRTPLSLAASYGKKEAVNFLISKNVEINQSSQPPLCAAIDGIGNEMISLEIVKTLLKNRAIINIQNEFSESPLILAAENKSLSIMRYLLSQGANLFLTYSYDDCRGIGYVTALGIAYKKYIADRQCFKEDDVFTQHAKKCLDLLVEAAADYLYREGFKQNNVELFITNAINDLSGNFTDPYCDNHALKKFLEDTIKPHELITRIKTERTHAFCMGSALTETQREMKTIPAIHRFFQHDGRHDLTREIFSYVHPTKKAKI